MANDVVVAWKKWPQLAAVPTWDATGATTAPAAAVAAKGGTDSVTACAQNITVKGGSTAATIAGTCTSTNPTPAAATTSNWAAKTVTIDWAETWTKTADADATKMLTDHKSMLAVVNA